MAEIVLKKLYINSDTGIRVSKLKDEFAGANSFFSSNATVTLTVKTASNNTTVMSATAMTYDTVKAKGTFNGTVQSTVSLVSWAYYNVFIDAVEGGVTLQYCKRCQAVPLGKWED